MTSISSSIQGVADTARWVAMYRAIESERPDALFHDPYARLLAGPRGREISDAMPEAMRAGWAFVARTVLFDQFIQQQVQAGVTLVVNLAAGMDARPYRMALPTGLRWVEVDQRQVLAEKVALLGDHRPICSLERIAMDLEAEGPRRDLLHQLGESAERALVITEGLLAYLSETQVGRLAEDLAAEPAFQWWIADLTSPRLLQIIQKQWGRPLAEGGAVLRFAPEDGPAFFARHGWQAVDVRSTLTTAGRIGRLPFFLRLVARIPATGRFHPRRPWSGVCLLTRPPRDRNSHA